MFNKSKLLSISICISSLTACSVFHDNDTTYAPATKYNSGAQLYPESYDSAPIAAPSTKTVVVPESYHVSTTAAPASAKNVDQSWISAQNPGAFTIEIADSDKPSQVSSALANTPKTARTAEIKYKNAGKDYYKAVYGTYPTYQDAENALKTLPENVKQSAGVKTWGSVQTTLQAESVN